MLIFNVRIPIVASHSTPPLLPPSMCLRSRLRRIYGRRRGHSKIYILHVIYIEYLADMVQWQNDASSRRRRESLILPDISSQISKPLSRGPTHQQSSTSQAHILVQRRKDD